jgi:peptidoglycan hydrolase-like protein with peptidoglycan-binding domain
MRMVLAAICLIVLLALGWVLKGLMSDHTEREFAVHYSWIVKWALTLSRESHRVPDNASFSSPRIEVAGNPNRWMLTGRLTWRDADGQTKDEPYTAVVANTCKAYADPNCWRLDDFAAGEGALALAEAAPNAPAPEPTDTSPAPTPPSAEQKPAVAEQQPAAPAKQPDAVLSLLQESPPDRSDAAVPEAPSPPLSEGVPIPERKPSPPSRVADADTQLALSEPTRSQTDGLPALETSAEVPPPADTASAVADSGAVATDADRAAARVPTGPANAVAEAASGSTAAGDQDSNLALAPDQVAGAGSTNAAISTQQAPEPVTSPLPAPDNTAANAVSPATPPAASTPSSPSGASTQVAATAAAEPPVGLPSVKPTPAPPPPQPAAAMPSTPVAANPAPVQAPSPQTVAAAPAAEVAVPPAKPATAPPPQPVAAAPSQPAPQTTAPSAETATPVPAEPEINVATATSALPPAKSEKEPAPGVPNSSLAALPSDTTEPAAAAFPDARHDPALIVLIQDRLNRAGFDAGLIDGRFGARTQRALIIFQREVGLPVDGEPSTTVLAALDQRLAKKTAAAEPTTAPTAAKAPQPAPQAASAPAAQPLPLPAAPPQPQVAALPPSPPAAQPAPPPPPPAPQQRTATVPAPTLQPAPSTTGQPVSLTQPEATPTPATSSADESLIFLIQNRLRQAGYSPGRYDGRMDEGTANAIRAYQTKKKLPVNGIPSRALLERLESELLQNRPNAQPAPTPLGLNTCVPGAELDCAIHPA